MYTGAWPWKGTCGQTTGGGRLGTKSRVLELPSEASPESCCLHTSRPSLEEVGAGSGIAGAVSETSQVFWGKLERPLHQNLEKFMWDG